MRRIVVGGLGAALAVMALGAPGCGGGIEQGVPQDTKPQPVPANVQTRMGPPPKKLPHAGHSSLPRGTGSNRQVRGHA